MNKNTKIIGGALAIVLLAVLGWSLLGERSEKTANFSLNASVLPQVWKYAGVYSAPELATNVQKNIETLNKKLGEDGADTYDLHVSLAQQYMFIGEGKDAYTHLVHAGEINPKNSLSYQTLGWLMESLGAMDAAEDSFNHAISVEPQIVQNHLALIMFYIKQNTSPEKIDAAFIHALEQSGRAHNVLVEYAQWLEGRKDIARAIGIWEEVLKSNPQNIPIKDKITQLKKKL